MAGSPSPCAPWACPRDGTFPLEARAEPPALVCPQCQTSFPAQEGIPDFVWFEGDESGQIQRAEQEARERELAWPTEPREVFDAQIEAEAVLGRLRPGPDDCVLDAGCGLGRLTLAVLATGARVTAVDFSPARLRFMRAHAPANAPLTLAAADVTRLPLPPGQFSRLLCTQVLEHLPTPELRRETTTRLAALLRPGGELVLTVYHWDRDKQARGLPREGRHESGIFYHCYTAAELEADLAAAPGLRVLELTGLRHYVPGAYRLWPRLGPLGRGLDHACARAPALTLPYASLLLAHARVAAQARAGRGPQPPAT